MIYATANKGPKYTDDHMFTSAIAANMTDPVLYTTTATAGDSYSQVFTLKQLFMTQ